MNATGLGRELLPGVAAGLDDGVIGGEDTIAELVRPQILPDILDRVEFG